MKDTVTCCVFFKEAMDTYCGDDMEKQKIFTAGFWHGLAEKVALGACKAAMVRPSLERNLWAFDVLEDVARRYKLVVVPIRYHNMTELWITKRGYKKEIIAIFNHAINSAEWHRARGLLCGVPEHDIDPLFHTRRGYGKYSDDKNII